MSEARQNKFLALYEPVHDRFERFCRARAYHDMPYEDLINESLLIAYKKFEDLRNKKSFLPFLVGISKRVLANARRKKKAETVADEESLHNFPDPEDVYKQQGKVDLLHRALARLPELQREALILFEISGFNIKEIMEIQSSGASAVKQRLARGRKELTRVVKEEFSIQTGDL